MNGDPMQQIVNHIQQVTPKITAALVQQGKIAPTQAQVVMSKFGKNIRNFLSYVNNKYSTTGANIETLNNEIARGLMIVSNKMNTPMDFGFNMGNNVLGGMTGDGFFNIGNNIGGSELPDFEINVTDIMNQTNTLEEREFQKELDEISKDSTTTTKPSKEDDAINKVELLALENIPETDFSAYALIRKEGRTMTSCNNGSINYDKQLLRMSYANRPVSDYAIVGKIDLSDTFVADNRSQLVNLTEALMSTSEFHNQYIRSITYEHIDVLYTDQEVFKTEYNEFISGCKKHCTVSFDCGDFRQELFTLYETVTKCFEELNQRSGVFIKLVNDYLMEFIELYLDRHMFIHGGKIRFIDLDKKFSSFGIFMCQDNRLSELQSNPQYVQILKTLFVKLIHFFKGESSWCPIFTDTHFTVYMESNKCQFVIKSAKHGKNLTKAHYATYVDDPETKALMDKEFRNFVIIKRRRSVVVTNIYAPNIMKPINKSTKGDKRARYHLTKENLSNSYETILSRIITEWVTESIDIEELIWYDTNKDDMAMKILCISLNGELSVFD